MAILQIGTIIATALWPQGDIRDPLGIWGMRQEVTGDASGDGIQVIGRVLAGQGAAYVYTCYSVNVSQKTGTLITGRVKCDLLCNWPDVDPLPGVQAYRHVLQGSFSGSSDFAGEKLSIDVNGAGQILDPFARFILLFDPRPSTPTVDIIDLQLNVNSNLATYSFEAYGYFWDRSVMQAPGGPRHPGSS